MRACKGAVLLALVASAHATFETITDNEDDVDFVYPGQPNSERGLPLCRPAGVCSALHLRLWQPLLVERLCRCPGRAECPWHWTDPPDTRTMSLNSRSQLKFCEHVGNMSVCGDKQPALLHTTTVYSVQEGSAEDSTETTYTALCLCPQDRYWQLLDTAGTLDAHNNGTTSNSTSYLCSQLGRCETGQFCGHLRQDHFSTYHRCSCPRRHLCLSPATHAMPATELLFQGPAYRSTCTPHPLTSPSPV